MNEISVISGVTCYEKDGTAYLRLEDVAWGLGFSKAEKKNGKEYATIRWDRLTGYLAELGFDHKWSKDDFIPENVFYRLAMKAKNETAEKFQALVADEIIPSIRKHGAYATPDTLEKLIADPDTTIRLLTELKCEQDRRKRLQAKVENDAPKVLFADAVAASGSSILIGELAKLLRQNGVEIGQNRLFSWMREHGYLISSGSQRNLPTQRSVERGLFEVKESLHLDGNGCQVLTKTPKVTGRGQTFFISKILKSDGIAATMDR